MNDSAKGYLAGEVKEYFYPELGDPQPPGGADVHLLTNGGICVRGTWPKDNRNGSILGWAPLPKRNHAREAQLLALRASRK